MDKESILQETRARLKATGESMVEAEDPEKKIKEGMQPHHRMRGHRVRRDYRTTMRQSTTLRKKPIPNSLPQSGKRYGRLPPQI
jgi:hypothetical protein